MGPHLKPRRMQPQLGVGDKPDEAALVQRAIKCYNSSRRREPDLVVCSRPFSRPAIRMGRIIVRFHRVLVSGG